MMTARELIGIGAVLSRAPIVFLGVVVVLAVACSESVGESSSVEEGPPAGSAPQARAERGKIPKHTYADQALYRAISPTMGVAHHNQPSVINGYLLLAGNGAHEFWDIAEPTRPVMLSQFESPHRNGEAESHTVSFSRADDALRAVLISGRGVDFWDVSNPRSPALLSTIELDGIDYGDNTNAVWGVFWQGDYVFVGGTSTGLHVVDASDPRDPEVVTRVPTSSFGGVSAGALFAIGNLLVITTPKESAGVATLDIGDPRDPTTLDFERASEKSYIGSFYGTAARLLTPFRTYDVTTDPRSIRLVSSVPTYPSEYMSFGDEHLFLGLLRPNPGAAKYALDGHEGMHVVGVIEGRDLTGNDDQFSLPIGNLLVLSDDEADHGSFLAVHAKEPDTTPPAVAYVNPANGATRQPTTSRIGISFSDQIELASVDASTFIVRPVGGAPLAGTWGHMQTIVNFWPDEPLSPHTTYEVVLPAGGITDLAGNALAAEFRSVFSTGSSVETTGHER